MKTTKLIAAIAMLTASSALSAQVLRFDLDEVTESGVNPPTMLPSYAPAPWSYVTFTELGLNQVEMKVGSYLVGDEFISMLGLNVDPTLNLSALTFSNAEQFGNFTLPSISVGANSTNGGGGTRFDIGLAFATSNSSNGSKRFNEQDWVSYTITYSGQGSFNPSSFDFLDKSGELNTIAHVQSIGSKDTSAWITNSCGPTTPPTVPEPSAAALGLLGSILLLRRRK